MKSDSDELKMALDAAVISTRQFDFDRVEVLSSEVIGESEGKTVFRFIVRLWTSAERIEEIIATSSDGQDVALMREILVEGNKICIAATREGVINHKWLGVQFS
jgi:hypothetical protein